MVWSGAQRVARVTARASAAILPAPVSRGGRGGVQAGNVCVATGHLLRDIARISRHVSEAPSICENLVNGPDWTF